MNVVPPDLANGLVGFSPVKVARYGGLIVIPFLVRKIRNSEESWKDQIRGWNTNLVMLALLADVTVEFILWFGPSIARSGADWKVIGLLFVWIIAFVATVGQLFYGYKGTKATLHRVKEIVKWTHSRM